MYIEAAPLKTDELWLKLHAAIDLIAHHAPVWIRRMRRTGNTVNVRRIPGTRARLYSKNFTVLDPYLLANFLPSQIAASIVHEATHAMVRSWDIPQVAESPAREERVCRRAELRFGRRLLVAGVEGADAVVARAEKALSLPDEGVGVVVDWQELRAIGIVTRINDMPVPLWLKRFLAKRQGVLDTPHAQRLFGSKVGRTPATFV